MRAINSIIYYERPFTSVTGAFSHYIAFVIEVACGFIAKISGDALVIFLPDCLIPCNTNCEGEHENPKATYFQHFSHFDNGSHFDVHFCRLR